MEGTDPPSDLGKHLQADSLTSDHHSRTLYDLYCQNAARAKATSKRSGGAAELEAQPAQQHQRHGGAGGGAGGGKGSCKGAASQKGKQRQRLSNQGRRGGDRRGGYHTKTTPNGKMFRALLWTSDDFEKYSRVRLAGLLNLISLDSLFWISDVHRAAAFQPSAP